MNNVQHFDSMTGLPLHSNVFHETIDINKRKIQYKKNVPGRFQKIKLEADAKLHPRRCIVLDVIQSLQSIQCHFDIGTKVTLILTFDSIFNAYRIYYKWIGAGIEFVSGSKEWNCRHKTIQESLIIILRLKSLHIQNNKIFLSTLQDKHLSPWVCFANLTVSLFVEQIVSRKKETKFEKKFFSDVWYFIPKEPHGNETFFPGQTIRIQWIYLNIDGNNHLKIVLVRKRVESSIPLTQFNTYIDQQNISFTIPSLSNFSIDNQYYFQFEFLHQFSQRQFRSSLFSMSNETMILPGTLFLDKNISFPGDSLRIDWQSHNFDTTSIMLIRFCRADISINHTLDTFTVSPTVNSYIYTISPQLERSNNGKPFYFEFDYCTISSSFLCKQRTNEFVIFTRPSLLVTYPINGDWFVPFQRLNLTWLSFNFKTQDDQLEIKLIHSKIVSSINHAMNRLICSLNSSGSCFYTLPDVISSTSNDYYFQFNWCEHWYSIRCTVDSNRFSIIRNLIGSWNYDPSRQSSLESKPLLISHCDKSCPTNHSNLTSTCQLCTEGRTMSIDMNCINCWAIYDYHSIQIDFVRHDNSMTFDYFSMHIHSNISVNLDLSISANYGGQFRGSLPLPTIPILKPLPFTIGHVPFDLSMVLESSIPWHLDMDAINNFTVGIDYQLESNVTLIMNQTKKSVIPVFNQTLKRNYHPMKGYLKSNIQVDLAYRPVFKLILGILTIEVSSEGYLIFEAKWQNPPFPSLPTLIFNWNKDIVDAQHVSIPFDACISSHFTRYHSMCGIRKTKLSISMSTLINYLTYQNISYSTPSLFDLGPFEMCSGCIF